MSEQELDQMIAQSKNTQRIVTNLARTVREASYPGTNAYQVAEGLNFLDDIAKQIKNGIEKLDADLKSAKKAAKDAEKAPLAAVPDAEAAPEEAGSRDDAGVANVG